MGIDVSAQLVVGEKFIRSQREIFVTKYDPDSGEPFHKKVKEDLYHLEGDENIVLNEMGELKGIELFYDPDGCHGLDANPPSFCIQGIPLCNVDLRDHKFLSQIDKFKLTQSEKEYKEVVGREAKMWLSMGYDC